MCCNDRSMTGRVPIVPSFESDSEQIGLGVRFGNNVSIKANRIEIDDNVIFQDDISIVCRGRFKIGHHSIVGRGTRVQCSNLTIGHWFYSCKGLEIGAGGCNSKEANVQIGNCVSIFETVLINPNSPVIIGDNCGIGREAQIWTHGAWLDPLNGFPSDFGPVSIGSNVWLPARSIMLPNSAIGDNCVIGINSIVNKKIPSGSFAAGSPVRIIRANAYPVVLSPPEKTRIIRQIINDWRTQIDYKAPDLIAYVECFDIDKIRLEVADEETIFDCGKKTVQGATSRYSEDLRDYLRRRGIKIYTDSFFNSL